MDWLAILLGPAVTVAAITWIAKLIWGYVAERRRKRNIIRALLAEIEVNFFAQRDLFQKGTNLDTIIDRIKVDKDYIPLIFVDKSPNRLFEELKSDLVLLPNDVLKPVIAYYKEDSRTNSVVKDLRGPRFVKLDTERRITAFRLLWEQVDRTGNAATEAIARLRDHLDRP